LGCNAIDQGPERIAERVDASVNVPELASNLYTTKFEESSLVPLEMASAERRKAA
jgi:hypothetical protein